MLEATRANAVLGSLVRERILARNEPSERFFERESLALARACAQMAQRFSNGGRLLAFGRGAYATDAMHVSVEFIHPVIVGKRALPALDVSAAPEAYVGALCGENDMAIAFAPPHGDPELQPALDLAEARGAMTIALSGPRADYAPESPVTDEHMHQELFELLGHAMYESVHVFLEHTGSHESSSSDSLGFLYPFLRESEPVENIVESVAESIRKKARDAAALREQVAERQADVIASAITAMNERLAQGGRILAFGNGGSATDATDFVLDCLAADGASAPIPAISLACEPAVITATANDVGTDRIFQRQLIAQARPVDIALAFSTSGGSRNVVAALEEAGKRGLLTVALLGYDGGEIVQGGLADVAVVVDCDYIPRIQEAQGTIYHVLREFLTC